MKNYIAKFKVSGRTEPVEVQITAKNQSDARCAALEKLKRLDLVAFMNGAECLRCYPVSD